MVNVDNRGSRDPRGSNNSLYFIVGALVVAVLIIGWFMYGGDNAADTATDAEVTTEEPAVGETNNITVTPATPPASESTPAAEPSTPPATEPATPPAIEPAPTAPPAAEPAPATPPATTP